MKDELNILLLGETGVGKSTWINGFANFLAFDSLAEAEAAPIYCLIPASFTITDDDYNQRLISVTVAGEDNEVVEVGQSATQHPLSYVFHHAGRTVRLIDTPGIGDVRGLDQDKANFEFILNHISHIHDLHGVCILLKPNNARLNVMFTFCINELLTHLHKDAARNIVFCFTNSRSTFYKPGDTLPALKKLLAENPEVKIPINKSTLYCMDNEAIRFLYALKNGIPFPADDRKNFEASWEKSVQEYHRLFDHVTATAPHTIKNTISLNNARKIIISLGKPMAQISQKIQTDIVLAETKKREITTSRKSKEELVKDLFITETDVKTIQLDEPRTVCTASKCTEVIQLNGQWTTIYKTHCHGNCSSGKEVNSLVEGVVGHPRLKRCSAFDRSGNCKTCKCQWDYHMKVSYETSLETKLVKDFQLERELAEQATNIDKIEKFIETLQVRIIELKGEQQEVKNTSVKFALFLKCNAITPYNDHLIKYLNHFIGEEEKKGKDRSVLDGLLRMREEYESQIKALEEAMADGHGNCVPTVEELTQLHESLYSLKHCGVYLESMMEASLRSADMEFKEKTISRNHNYVVTSSTKKPPKRKSVMFKKLFAPAKGGARLNLIDDEPEAIPQTRLPPIQSAQIKTPPLLPPRPLPTYQPLPDDRSLRKDTAEAAPGNSLQNQLASVKLKRPGIPTRVPHSPTTKPVSGPVNTPKEGAPPPPPPMPTIDSSPNSSTQLVVTPNTPNSNTSPGPAQPKENPQGNLMKALEEAIRRRRHNMNPEDTHAAHSAQSVPLKSHASESSFGSEEDDAWGSDE